MRTFYDLVSDFLILSGDSSTANETLGQVLINQNTNRILAMVDLTSNRGSHPDVSVAGRNNYPLPYNAGKIRGIKITVDDKHYWPREISDRGAWETMTRSVVESDYIQYFFVDPATHEILLYPYFSRSALDITIFFQKIIHSRSASDYATGTVSRSAASRSVRGTDTVFTWDMVGRYIKIEADPYWDEIAEVIDDTHLLTRRESRSATDDGDYKISEIIPLPVGFEDLPLWKALAIYFQKAEESGQAREYERMYKEGLNDLIRSDSKTTGNILIKGPTKKDIRDINDWPTDMA